MKDVARWAVADQRDLFTETAARRRLNPAIVEKDFWVCWSLMQLFELPQLEHHLVFKGGTSLSKAYGAIQRFSEDIDISLSEKYLGFSDVEPDALSRTARGKRLRNIGQACKAAVSTHIVELLREKFTEELGDESGYTWSIETSDENPEHLIFNYRLAVEAQMEYISGSVKLEFGSGVDPQPSVRRNITSYAAEEFPALFKIGASEITCLEIERTFWEKATILHMVNTRALRKLQPRMSRHFYDCAILAECPDLGSVLTHLDILVRVSEHKQSYFETSGVNYSECYARAIKLVPASDVLAALVEDYQAMKSMFFNDVIPFNDIVARLYVLEAAINQACRQRFAT